jgi:hypothetical protein
LVLTGNRPESLIRNVKEEEELLVLLLEVRFTERDRELEKMVGW